MLTLMTVHAHPDDESIGTGGILARAASEGIRTVLVTCTNGELGDMPGGLKPDHDEHDPQGVVALRRGELERSCEILGVRHLEMLGYHDSGMMGWPQNTAPHAFWNTPVEEAAKRVAELMERYEPDVVVTYDANGFYGHPDHIQTHRVTMLAAEMTGIPKKIYETAIGKKEMRRFAERLAELGIAFDGGGDFDVENPPFGIDDELITTVVDVAAFTKRKREAIAAHASQGDSMWFMSIPPDAFDAIFAREEFVRRFDSTGAPVPETDLFAGLR